MLVGGQKVNFFKRSLLRLRNIWRPDNFQGIGVTDKYFEGWYYKIVDKEEKNVFAVIVGLSLAGENSHSFIQVLNGKNHDSFYYTFKKEEFLYSPDKFEVELGENYFSKEHLRLSLDDGKNVFRADLSFGGVNGWPVKLLSPGVMSYYAFVPFMECYHGVTGFKPSIFGSFAGIDFTGGKAYIEKDRGTSLPSEWIWIQSNHFEEEDASLMVSIAKIPWLGHYFSGFLVGFWLQGRLYRFATYLGSSVTIREPATNSVVLEFSSFLYKLKVKAIRTDSGELASPVRGNMKGRINESITAKVELELYNRRGASIYKGSGRNAGFELVGNIEVLKNGISTNS